MLPSGAAVSDEDTAIGGLTPLEMYRGGPQSEGWRLCTARGREDGSRGVAVLSTRRRSAVVPPSSSYLSLFSLAHFLNGRIRLVKRRVKQATTKILPKPVNF